MQDISGMLDFVSVSLQRACIPRHLLQVIERAPDEAEAGSEVRRNSKKPKDKTRKRRQSSKSDREAETPSSEPSGAQ